VFLLRTRIEPACDRACGGQSRRGPGGNVSPSKEADQTIVSTVGENIAGDVLVNVIQF